MQIVDLTHTISENMQVYPGTEPPVFKVPCTVEKDGFKETEIKLYSHTGTHMDSPSHIFIDGKSLDQFSVEYFYGNGVIVDCTNINYGGEITLEHIMHIDDLENKDFILFYTGWSEKWGKDEYFEGFPTISLKLAEKISRLNIKGIGIDTISVEPITSHNLEIHHKILGAGKLIIENLNNLNQLVNKDFIICALPLKIENADGSPVRAVALLN